MYLLRLYNDIHNEFDVYDIPVLPNEAETILSIAGDIYNRKCLMEWLRPLAARFKAIVCVLGNHDYWKGDVDKIPFEIQHWLDQNPLPNVHVLFDSHVMIDGVLFFGGTGWTDLNNRDPLTMINYKPFNDFRYIRCRNYSKRWSPNEMYDRHQHFKAKMRYVLDEQKDVRTVVLSHHAPHQLSSDPRHQNFFDNGFYYSDLSSLILDYPQIVLWHHGHVHYKNIYQIGDTFVACNPRGYVPTHPVHDFDEHMILDLDAMPVL